MTSITDCLKDFETFFSFYKETWNSCDAEKMSQTLSPELAVRWAGPGATVSDWGYEEAKKGWAQAYNQYEGQQPKWHFTNLHITLASDREAMATFWLTFELNGKKADVVKLFVQRFRRDVEGEWKLLREYCESLEPKFFSI